MLLEAIRAAADLKFELGNYFEPLMLSVLHYMEMILDDRYLLRRYINCPDDKLSKGGVEIRKNYRRLVSLRDEFESVRKSRQKACCRRVTGYSRAGALPQKERLFLKGHLTIAFADASFPVPPYRFPVCVSRTFLKENIMAENRKSPNRRTGPMRARFSGARICGMSPMSWMPREPSSDPRAAHPRGEDVRVFGRQGMGAIRN